MTNQTTLPAESRETVATCPHWLKLLATALMRDGNEWTLPNVMMPTPDQKQAISNRLAVLTSQLFCDGSSDKALAVELARMLEAFPSPNTDHTSRKLRMEAYFEALEGIPIWCVSLARSAVSRGDGGCDPRFAPTPAQFATLARKYLQSVRDEITVLRRIQGASDGYHEPGTDEHERVSTRFAELAEELRRKVNVKRGHDNPVPDIAATAERLGVDLSTIPDAMPRRGN